MAEIFTDYVPAQRLYQAAKLAWEILHATGNDLEVLDKALHDCDQVGAERKAYRLQIEEARELGTDELEISNFPMLSAAEDGVWVSAWVWVPMIQEDEDD